MHASYLGGIDAARRHTAESSAALILALRNPDYAIEAVYSLARRTFGVAAVVVDGIYAREWKVAGGPAATRAYKVLHDGFRREAVLAAIGADLVGRDATDERAIDQWLNTLKSKGSPYYHGDAFPWIDDLPTASAEMCAWFAARAYQQPGAEPHSEMSPSKPFDASPLFTVKQAAKLLKCHEDTIRAMGVRGQIEIIDTGPRRQRIKASELRA